MDIIEMDAASSRKIDDIRDLIEHTKYQPASAKFKIFIIDDRITSYNVCYTKLLRVHLDDVHVASLVGAHAVLAGLAGVRRRPALAHQRLGEDPRRRGLARAAQSREEVGV